MKPITKRISEKVVISHVAVVAPTTRLLVVAVEVFATKDGKIENDTFASPVVSIRTTVVDLWYRRELGDDDETDQQEYADAEELRKARYRFGRQDLDDEILVLDPDGELVSLADLRRVWQFTTCLVAAMWDPSEDEQRLAPFREKLICEATAKLQKEQAA